MPNSIIFNSEETLSRVNNADLEVFTYHTDGMPADLQNFGGVITAGQWHHVAAVKFAGFISIYLDGFLLSNGKKIRYSFDWTKTIVPLR